MTHSPTKLLQSWYLSRCNGSWEHTFGVKIDTIDNPGWRVEIDLTETELDSAHFKAVEVGLPDDEAWMVCNVQAGPKRSDIPRDR